MKLKLKIIELDGICFDGEVDLVNLTIASGTVTILANHLPLISSIEICHMYYKIDGVTYEYALSGGTLFVSESECKIITNAVERKEDIDFDRAFAAKERAEYLLKMGGPALDVARAEVALKRAINRLSFK